MTASFPLPRFYGSERDRDRTTARYARAANGAPRIPWDRFYTDILEWRQGEHLAVIGPTGQGKTTLLHALLPKMPYVVVFATKPRDESMTKLIRQGYVKLERWRKIDPDSNPRIVLWPPADRLDSDKTQELVFRDAFDRIYRAGGWCVAIDELWYIINRLGLSKEIKTYLLQARALGISLVCATQRPVSVPVEVYDQSTHLFFMRDNDRRNQDRLSDINSRDSALVRELVGNLEPHQVLYINTRTGFMCRTKAPMPRGG